MKKLLVLCLLLLFITAGCGKVTKESAVKTFVSDVNGSKSYKINGKMEIVNNEETFTYSLEAYYLKDNYYKVILVNQTNNHEQIILRNNDGVYVVTPSLNKSFKFQSEWPFNSSQAYILESLVQDIKNDENVTMEETENNYILKSSVNYPNNTELTYQKIYFDKKMNIESVEVYNKDDIVKIKVAFTNVDLKAGLDNDDFVLDDLIDDDCCGNVDCTNKNCENPEMDDTTDNNETPNQTTENSSSEQTSGSIESIIYPLYVPTNTHLKTSEKIDTENGERVILTFSGDKDFILIEETAKTSEDFEVIPVFGDPMMVSDTLAALSANSLSWSTNNIDYYLASNDLSQEEMITIASSIGNTKTVLESK
ncbi:MAG: outer membrane lipoprotein carrier protein LolA [Bacilli bacterium]|nr:outer membrane lipoprotein carrier protein LolA [Bacilli bacterium]